MEDNSNISTTEVSMEDSGHSEHSNGNGDSEENGHADILAAIQDLAKSCGELGKKIDNSFHFGHRTDNNWNL